MIYMPLIATLLVFSGEGNCEVPESVHTSRPIEGIFSKTSGLSENLNQVSYISSFNQCTVLSNYFCLS